MTSLERVLREMRGVLGQCQECGASLCAHGVCTDLDCVGGTCLECELEDDDE